MPAAAGYTQQPSVFTFSASDSGLQLGSSSLAPEIRVAPNDLPGVKRAANDLAADFGRVLRVTGTVVVADWDSTVSQKGNSKPIILHGTVGQSSLIDSLANSDREVIQWQQSALTRILGKPSPDISQAWIMYKQKGMTVSEDVMLLWSDDNRGNIRRIPIGTEGSRKDGAGMYCHLDYVGSPRNYKWINTIQLQKTFEQMSLAYDSGVNMIWVANVGDLKGFLKARMKYEDLSKTPFAFNTINYDEAELNFKEWTNFLSKAQAVYDSLSSSIRPSFFEGVPHPVMVGRGVFEIYTKATLSCKYASEYSDAELTNKYHSLLNGKWNKIMAQTHIGYDNWQEPTANTLPPLSWVTTAAGLGVMCVPIQGLNASFPVTSKLTLPAIKPYKPASDQRWLEVYTRDNVAFTYSISSNASVAALTITNLNASTTATVFLPVENRKAPSSFKGHVESNGVVSIEAEHFASDSSDNVIIPDYGRTFSGVKFPSKTASQVPERAPSWTTRSTLSPTPRQ
ncbi:hypothetical protein VTI74DRAFT_2170 [Chaetomium olivicolor]